METYKYRFMSRPASSFTCPMENFIAFHEDKEFRKHGIVEYSKILDIEQAKHYDLAPMFLDNYNGKQVLFFEDCIGTIALRNNTSGQLFFAVTFEDDTTSIVWHEFLANVLNQRYKIVTKMFFYTDQSGHGVTGDISESHIRNTWDLSLADIKGVSLSDYLKNSNAGDEFLCEENMTTLKRIQ